MKSSLLLPHRYKNIGWCILIAALIAWIVTQVFQVSPSWHLHVFSLTNRNFSSDSVSPGFIDEDVYLEVVGLLAIIGGLMVGFSREKTEDEFIARLRLSSLQWAVLVNYGLLILCIMFIYGLDFLVVMTYNLITVLLIFIVRFNYILFRTSKQARREK